MKNIFKVLSQLSLILGCILGSGFVGGKELILIFGKANILGVLVFALLFALFTYLILTFCGKHKINDLEEFSSKLFGKYENVSQLMLLLCYFVVVVTMLAGANAFLNQLFGIDSNLPIFSFVTAVLSWLIMLWGTKGIELFNKIAVPVILVYLAVVYIVNINTFSFDISFDVIAPSKYALFNMVMSLGILTTFGSTTNKKQNIIVCSALGVIIFVFATLQLGLLAGGEIGNASVPLLLITKSNLLLYILGAVAILLAILTSLLANALPIIQYVESFVGDFSVSTAIVFFVALLLSMLGFDLIVKYCYPAVAILGIVLLIYIAATKRRTRLSA